MEGNPFMALAGMLGNQNQVGALKPLLGKVTATAPFTVAAAGLSISGSSLLISAELCEERIGSVSGGGSCSIPKLAAVGDSVLLITEDYQVFYCLCKVVGV